MTEEEAERPWALAPGETAGEWRVVSRLGRGGMGEVYAVEPPEGGPPLALKLFIAEGRDADFLRRRFRDMANALRAVSHPHVARVLRSGDVARSAGAPSPSRSWGWSASPPRRARPPCATPPPSSTPPSPRPAARASP